MTHITQVAPRSKKSVFFSMAMVLTCFVLLLVQSRTVHAQWATNGTNINNTNSGNVGVGTTAPATTLHVATESTGVPRGITNSQHSADNNGALFVFRKSRGTILSPSTLVNGDNIGNLFAEGYDGTSWISGGRIRFAIDGPVSAGIVPTSVQFFSGNNNFGGFERMRISSAGNVGIGTVSPVFDANVARYLTLDGGPSVIGSIGAAGGTINPATAVAQMAFINSTLPATDKRLGMIVGSTEASTNSGVLDFYTASGGAFSMPRLRITSSGNIGVGTISPGHRLDVQGGAINASGGLCIAGDCKTAWSQVGGGGSSQWTTAGSNIFYNSGSVGIGTSAPSSLLHLQSGSNTYLRIGAPLASQSAIAFNDDTSGQDIVLYRPQNTRDFSIWTATFGNVFNVTQAGNVGIGTTSPTAQLHIAGTNGPANYTAAPAPEAFRVIGGVGGNGNWGGSQGGVGGGLSFAGGTGGTPVAGSQAALGGKGGSINLVGGNGGPNIFNVGGGAGGDVSINGGAGVANSDGNIILANLRGKVGIGSATPGYRLDVQGGQINASGGLCIAGVCKSNWTEAGGSQWSTAGSNIHYNTGNVGIGTTAPGSKLFIGSGTPAVATLPGVNVALGGNSYLSTSNGTVNTFIGADASPYGIVGTLSNHALGLRANNVLAVTVLPNGNVGIGATAPTAKLDVAGNISVTGTGNITANGTITGGNIIAKYQDVAEWVESSQTLSAGTVVVLDHTKSNQVIASSQAYDTRVAGVISLQPGITLGESGEAKVLVATTGRVRIKVDATRAPIQVGDLLVTSDREGFAMRSLPVNFGGVQLHRPGTLVGKALEPLASGTGEILVLLSLQ